MLATCCCAPWKAGTGSRHGCLFFLVERHAARLAAVYVTCPPGTYWDLACCCRFLSSRQSAFRIRPPSNKGRRRGPRRPRVVHGLGLPPPPPRPPPGGPPPPPPPPPRRPPPRPAGRPPPLVTQTRSMDHAATSTCLAAATQASAPVVFPCAHATHNTCTRRALAPHAAQEAGVRSGHAIAACPAIMSRNPCMHDTVM
jgi:hypothetical protein